MRTVRTRYLAVATAVAMTTTLVPAVAPTALAGPDDGKTAATQAHVDAPKTFWNSETNTFELKTSFQSQALPVDESVVWIGKGWGSKGTNQYQFPVDDEILGFLGDQGDVLYASPAVTSGGHDPVWLGFGADSSLPIDQFRDGVASLDILEVDGPGKVEMFRYTNDFDFKNLIRLMSSTELGLRSAKLTAGSHTHNFTTFSKPGRYEFTYRTIARGLNGEEITSEPQKLAIQVGGQKPLDTPTPSTKQRYDDAPVGDLAAQNYQLTVAPKSNPTQDGDANLSTISFDAGTAIDGTLTLSIDGHFLTDLPVTGGKASYDELLGAGTSQLQAVFTPASEGARWISQPVEVAKGASASVTSKEGEGVIVEKRHVDGHGPLPTSRYTPTDRGVTAAVTPMGNGYSKATLTFADKNIRGFVGGGWYDSPDAARAEHPFEANVIDGTATVVFQDFYDGYTPKFEFYPHPDMNVAHATIVPDEAYAEAPLTYSTTLVDDSSAAPSNPSENAPAENVPAENAPKQPAPAPADAQRCTDKLLLDRGHIDMLMTMDDSNAIDVKVKDETAQHGPGLVMRDPSEILVGIYDNALFKPVSFLTTPEFGFVGKGEKFYYLPQGQNPDILWPGYNTMGIDYSKFDGTVELHIEPKSIPEGASYGLFMDGQWGAAGEVLVDSTKNNYTINTTYAAHVHSNWAFSHPGVYELDFSYSGTLKDGTKVSSDKHTLTFAIGDKAVKDCTTPAPEKKPGDKPEEKPGNKPGDSSPAPKPSDMPTPDPKPAPKPAPKEPGQSSTGSSADALGIPAIIVLVTTLVGSILAIAGPFKQVLDGVLKRFR